LLADSPQQLVYQLFLLYYGSPADPAGLEYWSRQIAADAPPGAVTLAEVAVQDKYSSQDYSVIPSAVLRFDHHTAVFGAADKQDVLALVEAFYRNAVDRAATVRERAYFFAQWQRSDFTAIQLAWQLVDQLSGQDLILYRQRLTRAQQFTAQVVASGRPYQSEHIAEARLFLREFG